MARKKNYIFTDKRHSQKAVLSTALGLISSVSLGIVVYLSYRKAGDVPTGYGVTGLLAVAFSLIGLTLGLVSVKEKETFKLFPWLGILFNLLALLGVGFVVYMGL